MRLREKPMRERKRTAVSAAPRRNAGNGKPGNVFIGLQHMIMFMFMWGLTGTYLDDTGETGAVDECSSDECNDASPLQTVVLVLLVCPPFAYTASDLDDEECAYALEEREEWADPPEDLGVGKWEDVDEAVGERGARWRGCEVKVECEERESCGDGWGEDCDDGYEGCEWSVLEAEAESGVEEVVQREQEREQQKRRRAQQRERSRQAEEHLGKGRQALCE